MLQGKNIPATVEVPVDHPVEVLDPYHQAVVGPRLLEKLRKVRINVHFTE